MDLIRVLIIEDSAFMRKMITEILESDERIKILGTARNGEEGLKKIKEISPDVVTLDIEMPIMDGMTTLKKIMTTNPLPVIILASGITRGSIDITQAISIGAIDFIEKPSGSISLDIHQIKEEMIEKVIKASQTKHNALPINKDMGTYQSYIPKYHDTIIAIGTSTGGPRALQKILTKLPSDFPAPILIVQHMPPGFTKSLAERLDSLSAITVKEASSGEQIKKGTAYIAPGDFHMKVINLNSTLSIELTKSPEKCIYRPAVDVLFHSVANQKQVNKIAVILTGMGSDGAEGIKSMKEQDLQAFVIAEAKESSIVYGMPKAAVNTGYVNQVIHLHKIADTIQQIVM